MTDTMAALINRLRERHVSHHGDGYEPPFINPDGPAAADLIEALSLPAEGYVLMPVEPTEAMVSAGMSEIDWCRDEQVQDKFRPFLKLNQDGSSYSGTSPGEDVRDAYRAMIAASSSKPIAPGDAG